MMSAGQIGGHFIYESIGSGRCYETEHVLPDGANRLGRSRITSYLPRDIGIVRKTGNDFMETINLFLCEPVTFVLQLIGRHSRIFDDLGYIDPWMMSLEIFRIVLENSAVVNRHIVHLATSFLRRCLNIKRSDIWVFFSRY